MEKKANKKVKIHYGPAVATHGTTPTLSVRPAGKPSTIPMWRRLTQIAAN